MGVEIDPDQRRNRAGEQDRRAAGLTAGERSQRRPDVAMPGRQVLGLSLGHLVRKAVSPAAIPAAMVWRSIGLVAMAASPLFLMLRHSMVMTGPCERLIVPVVVVLG